MDDIYRRGNIKLQLRDHPRMPTQYWLTQGFAGIPLQEEESKDARWLLLQHAPMSRFDAWELLVFAIERFFVLLFTGGKDD